MLFIMTKHKMCIFRERPDAARFNTMALVKFDALPAHLPLWHVLSLCGDKMC